MFRAVYISECYLEDCRIFQCIDVSSDKVKTVIDHHVMNAEYSRLTFPLVIGEHRSVIRSRRVDQVGGIFLERAVLIQVHRVLAAGRSSSAAVAE